MGNIAVAKRLGTNTLIGWTREKMAVSSFVFCETVPMKNLSAVVCIGLLAALGGCAPEVGSDKWCATMKDTPKGEWTMNDTRDYAKYCVLNIENEK